MSEFYEHLLEESGLIDSIIKKEFEIRKGNIYPPLYEAMKYSLFSGGKKIRPLLMKWCAEIGEPDMAVLNKAMPAIEYIHTYSLVHDDLPAMDDDNFRRGNPSSHVKFGEGIAILTGDALLTEAFLLLGEAGLCSLSVELAKCCGANGMVGGQAADIKGGEDIDYINDLKTANLFKAAASMGGIIGGVEEVILDKLSDYGINLGRAFQLRDDLLDDESEDQEKTRIKAHEIIKTAKEAINEIKGTEKLKKLADFVIARNN